MEIKGIDGNRNERYCAGDWIWSRGGERNPGWISSMSVSGESRLLSGNQYRWKVLEGGHVTQGSLILRRKKVASRGCESPRVSFLSGEILGRRCTWRFFLRVSARGSWREHKRIDTETFLNLRECRRLRFYHKVQHSSAEGLTANCWYTAPADHWFFPGV